MSIKDITKKYGDVFLDASFLIEEKKVAIPIAPSIDLAIGNGGLLEGTVATFSGQAGSGKSTTALNIAATAQKPEYGGRKTWYIDVESRLKKSNLEGIEGLEYSKDKFEIVRSTENRILSAEDFLNITNDLLKEHKQSIFIIDSASALCGLAEMAEDVKSDFRNASPKLMANFARHIAPIVTLNKQIVIITQHMIADTSGRGGFSEDGGNKVKHAADLRMRIKWTEKWVVGTGENEKNIGQILHWQVIKGPYGVVDKLTSYLRYGTGLDTRYENIMLACDLGVINKAGAGWHTMNFLEDTPKMQGVEKVYQYLVDNPDMYKLMQQKIKESLS